MHLTNSLFYKKKILQNPNYHRYYQIIVRYFLKRLILDVSYSRDSQAKLEKVKIRRLRCSFESKRSKIIDKNMKFSNNRYFTNTWRL